MPALTDHEFEIVRSLLKTFTADEWRILKALASSIVAARIIGGSPAPVQNGHASPAQDELSDSFLDAQPWTDRDITKNPKRWAGVDHAGFRYSEASSEWLECQASLLDYKAQKGREAVPVRLNQKGKPWHESDAFEAKICRAWARRNRGKDLPPPRAVSSENGASMGDSYEEEFVP